MANLTRSHITSPQVVLAKTNKRWSTSTPAGAAITIPADHSYGEVFELRYTSALSNTQIQGIFLDMRTSVANSSTVRGMEMTAQSEGNINVGVLSGATFKSIPRGTSGTITSSFGVEGECSVNSSSWAGTITNTAAVRGKVSMEDGGTYTNSSIFRGELESITGADVIGSILMAPASAGTVTATSVLDINVTATNFLEITSSGQGGLTVSADGMFKDPENDAEAGYITVLVGSTSYQVPIYALS